MESNVKVEKKVNKVSLTDNKHILNKKGRLYVYFVEEKARLDTEIKEIKAFILEKMKELGYTTISGVFHGQLTSMGETTATKVHWQQVAMDIATASGVGIDEWEKFVNKNTAETKRGANLRYTPPKKEKDNVKKNND